MNKIRIKKEYLIDIQKYKGSIVKCFFYRKAKSNFIP
jgi:hypothetical protein